MSTLFEQNNIVLYNKVSSTSLSLVNNNEEALLETPTRSSSGVYETTVYNNISQRIYLGNADNDTDAEDEEKDDVHQRRGGRNPFVL